PVRREVEGSHDLSSVHRRNRLTSYANRYSVRGRVHQTLSPGGRGPRELARERPTEERPRDGRCADAHTVDLRRDGSDPSRVPARRGAWSSPRASDATASGRDPGGRRRSSRERRLPLAARGGVMASVGIVLTVLVVALLWVAAVAFGRDSREGDRHPGATTATGPCGSSH